MGDRRAAYAFFGILLAFKVWTVLLIGVLLSSWGTVGFVLASHALWICVGIVVAWAPTAFWVRLLRVRSKRKQLQQAEWSVEDSPERARR